MEIAKINTIVPAPSVERGANCGRPQFCIPKRFRLVSRNKVELKGLTAMGKKLNFYLGSIWNYFF